MNKNRHVGIALALSGVFAATLSGTAGAAPVDPAEGELATVARALLLSENAAMLGETDRARAVAGVRPTLAARARQKAAARLALSEDRRVAREAAGVAVTQVTTEVKVRSVSGDGAVRVAEIEEHSGYPIEGSSQGTSSTSRHRVTYEWENGRWALADIEPLDEVSKFSARAMAAALPDEPRRTAIRHQVSSLRTGIAANLPALRAADAAKMAGKQVEAPDGRRSAGGKSVGGGADFGRPADKPFVGVVKDQVQTQGGEGRPYNYQLMVDYAYYFAKDNPVPYARDENDCTTFISWVLWNGRYEERGDESYPETLFNYDDPDVWYYRCNDCTPRHTYTWGGALNWNVYENNFGGRVTFMPYLSDLLLSDVFQMEFDVYGGKTEIPDHTTMVTGRSPEGWPLLSYHTEDTRNKSLWDVIGSEDGPYWAIRT